MASLNVFQKLSEWLSPDEGRKEQYTYSGFTVKMKFQLRAQKLASYFKSWLQIISIEIPKKNVCYLFIIYCQA